jgi:hypothetical protein
MKNISPTEKKQKHENNNEEKEQQEWVFGPDASEIKARQFGCVARLIYAARGGNSVEIARFRLPSIDLGERFVAKLRATLCAIKPAPRFMLTNARQSRNLLVMTNDCNVGFVLGKNFCFHLAAEKPF